MNETYENICEKIAFNRKDEFHKLLTKSIHVSNDSGKSTYAVHDNVIFKMNVFFKGFSPFHNEIAKGKSYEAGVHALSVIFEELAVEVEKEECFILFHIRNLGKFRLREDKLLKELKDKWHEYKAYTIPDQEFTRALKNMMRTGLIDYRKGNLHLKPSLLIRYKTGGVNERF